MVMLCAARSMYVPVLYPMGSALNEQLQKKAAKQIGPGAFRKVCKSLRQEMQASNAKQKRARKCKQQQHPALVEHLGKNGKAAANQRNGQ